MKSFENYSLLSHNTFGLDAKCRRFVEYATVEDACQVAHMLAGTDAYLIIGGGSNLLLTRDYDGIVVRSGIMGHEVLRRDSNFVWVRVGSGECWDRFVETCIAHGWYGAENLSLIPGDVGASAVQNIGAYGVEACSLIEEVEAVSIATGETVVFSASDCAYGYRQSRFKQDWKNSYLITYVTYRLHLKFEPRLDYGNIRAELERLGIRQPSAQELRDVIVAIRNKKLPDSKVEGNAGSFFVNPVVSKEKFRQLQTRYPDMPHYFVDEEREKIPAGWMIEQCGWKGRQLGRAGVHAKQALVLVNKGGATGQEIVALSDAIREDVRKKFDIEIYPEVNII